MNIFTLKSYFHKALSHPAFPHLPSPSTTCLSNSHQHSSFPQSCAFGTDLAPTIAKYNPSPAIEPGCVSPSPITRAPFGWHKRSRYRSVAATDAPALPDGATAEDAEYMGMCVALARKALGCTSPNPMVGCVIVKDGQIVGRGYHPKAGEPHAEVYALREAGAKAEGATAYVSLEPCNHFGRTPPCTQALIKAGVKCVVIGMVDPNPIVAGKGVATLKSSGIKVIKGVEEALCRTLNEAYIHRMLTKKPFVTLRFSMSLDGGFLGSVVESNDVGSYYSKLLQEHDAVIVTDAAVYDNPMILSLEPGAKQPLRVVVARSLDLPSDACIFDTSIAPTLVLTDEKALVADVQRYSGLGQSMEFLLREKGVDIVTLKELNLDDVLDICYQRGFCSVLLDSRGPDLSGLENFLGKQAIENEIVQKLVVAISPVISGDQKSRAGFQLNSTILNLERVSTRMSGEEVIVEGYIQQ